MVFKASILLLIHLAFITSRASASTEEADLRAAIQKKDWPEIVLLLEPKQGQNFEHDLDLARAYLSLERRLDALNLLQEYYDERKDERLTRLFTLAGSIFFNQETANLYYEGVRLLSISKFQEAKERLENALSKEAGQVLVLTRLVQVEIQLGQKDAAWNHLKKAQAFAPYSTELKLMGARLMLDRPDAEAEFASFLPLKSAFLGNEVTYAFWIEVLKRFGKTSELRVLQETLLRKNPTWTYALVQMQKSGTLSPALLKKYMNQIEKNLKDKAQFEERLEREMKATQYYWVGYIRFEDLVKNVR